MENESEVTNGVPTLRSLREARKLSRPELGRRINAGASTIQSWEEGEKIPRFDNAIALAKELGVSLEELARAMNLDIANLPSGK